MDLYNCLSKEEIALKETELEIMSISELKKLANRINDEWQDGKLEDVTIVIAALHQIALEMYKKQRRVN